MRKIDALGWYVTFGHVSSMEALRRHYRDRIGLPQIVHNRVADGDEEDKDLFWAGEAVILNFNHGGTSPQAPAGEADPQRARQVPIFRVHDLAGRVEQLTSRGVDVIGPLDGAFGPEAFAIDPMGLLTGLREVPQESDISLDRVARWRAARGEAFNPGCATMPEGWQELGWVRIRAADPLALAEHYAQHFGLPVVARRGDTVLLDIGDNVGLEIAPGGTSRAAPSAQMASGSSMIVRIAALDTLVADLAGAGIAHVGERYDRPKGSWAYFPDPEGNLLGCAHRNHPSAYCESESVAAEDIEARRRAIETRMLA